MSLVLRTVILWLHLVAAIIWLGGVLFQALVVCPALQRGALTAERLRFSLGLEARFRAIVWPAIGVVLFTGLVNIMNVWHAMGAAGATVPPAFVRVLSIKVLLVGGMIVLQAVHRLIVHPRRLVALAAWDTAGQEPPGTLLALQRLTLGLYTLLLGLAAGVVWCALWLRGA